jgi:hypothetical protein
MYGSIASIVGIDVCIEAHEEPAVHAVLRLPPPFQLAASTVV